MTTATTDKRDIERNIIDKCYALWAAEVIGEDESIEDVRRSMGKLLLNYDSDKATKWQQYARKQLRKKAR